MKKVLKKIFISIFAFIIVILIQNICKAVNLNTDYYKINNEEKIIYAIEPETGIYNLKIRLSEISSETGIKDEYIEQVKEKMKIYRDKTYQEEIKDGYVGTGMILKTEEYEYELSVVGDFDGDGKATQVELTNEIRHIIGLKESKIEGVKKYSADLTLDGQVDQRDITKFIKHIVYDELDLGKQDITPPIVDIEVIRKSISEITVKGMAIDKESGMEDKPIFTFYIKKENEPESVYVKKQSGKETVLNLTNLEPETVYTIKVEVQDKAGNVGIQEKDILIQDDKVPVITELTSTTNRIEIKATDEGIGIVGYAVTTSETEPNDSDFITVESTKELNITVTEKIQGTTYYVWVKDAMENVSERKSIITGIVTALTISNTTFLFNPIQETWTKESVTATVNTTVTGYTLQTSKDGQTWSNEASQTYTANGKIYARLWDGTNAGAILSENVTNIDTLAPKTFTPTATSTTNSIKVIANTEDADATSTSGKSGIAGYRFRLDSGSWTEYQTSGTYTWNNLSQTTSYTITVEAKDNVGNTKQETINKGTGAVIDLTTSNTTFTYSPVKEIWTNGSVTATVSTTVTGYALQTSKDGQTWSNETSQTYTSNGKIYARLWDGTNAGATLSENVTNIDTLVPKAFTPTATSTTKSIIVTAVAEDADATSTSGKSGISGYRFKLDSGSWTEYQTSGTYTWDNLSQTTDYTITVEAKDNAGNTKQGTVTKGTGTVVIPEIATYTPTEWTNGTVTVTLPTKEGFTTIYTTDGTVPTTSSTTYSEPFTVSSNCIVTYIYTDGTNIGGANTANITNIDTTDPTR